MEGTGFDERVTERVIYLPAHVVAKLDTLCAGRRREREQNPMVFRQYAESLLRSLPSAKETQ